MLRRTPFVLPAALRSRLHRAGKAFLQDDRGNVAVIFALCLIPIMISVGVAVDLSRALVLRERLSQAIDAAALAAGASMNMTSTQQSNYIQKYIEANYQTNSVGNIESLSVKEANDVITVTASSKMSTAFLGIIGYNSLVVNASTEVMRNVTGLELVMVLDNTGSMSGSKLKNLKTSAHKLVDILYGKETNPPLLRIGLVPFSAAVNVGTGSLSQGWIDDAGQSTLAKNKMDWGGSLNTVMDLYNQIPNRSWNGCVEARMMPYDTTDDAPTSADTKFQPYFAPDESDKGGYSNNYLKDKGKGNANKRQRDVTKYNGKSVGNSSLGPLKGCTTAPVTALTNNRTTVDNSIDAMTASGYTHIPVGVVWGWRLVSPDEPFTEGKSYSDQQWKKAMVILTDGENTIDAQNNDNGSNYGAYGYLAEGRIGTTNAGSFEDQLDTNTATVCANVKAKGIRVYSITFNVTSTKVKNLMQGCASEPSLYFDSPSGSELEAAFEAIARDLNNLRISR